MQNNLGSVDDGKALHQPICEHAIACRSFFTRILQVGQKDEENSGQEAVLQQRLLNLFRPGLSKGPALDLSDIFDEYEQFNVWTKNLGVFASDNSSLDFRLREASEARDGVISLLRGLEENLRECLFLLHQDRDFDHEMLSNDDDDQSDSDSSMDSDDDVLNKISFTAFELQNRFNNISETVNNLIKLAELIRSSGVRSRTSRAAKYEHIEDGVNHTLAFENSYLPLVLKHKFKLEGSLLERFRKAIAFRRRRFLYQAKHQKRLAYGNSIQLEGPKAPKTQREAKKTPKAAPNAPVIRRSVPAKRVVDNSTEAPTQATTFRIVAKPKAPSAIVSTNSKFDASGIDLPPPPPATTGKATHFECPYCCVLVPVAKREKRLWRQHVLADLQPYVCIEPDCPTPDILLETRDDWVEHQRWEHAMEWWCDGDDAQGKHPTLQFSTEDAFLAHLSRKHPSDLSIDAIKRRAQMASHPSLMPFSCCPFCDFLPAGFATLNTETPDTVLRAAMSQKILQEHLTHELLNIFLIALPERVDLEDAIADTDTERSPGKRSTDLGDLEFDEDDTFTSYHSPSSPPPTVNTSEDDLIDPEVANSLWATVWASPQLRKSVRKSYTGPALDGTIKHIAIRQDQQDNLESAQLEYGVWIPGIYINNEKLFSPRLVPSLYNDTVAGIDMLDLDNVPGIDMLH